MEFDFVSSYTHCNRTAVKKGKKWGFIDQNSKVIVPTIYDNIKNYQNGFAEVCQNGKWGFIDLNGKEICELKYTRVYPYSNGLAIVYSPTTCNLLNEEGKEIFPKPYRVIGKLSDGNFRLFDDLNECHLFIADKKRTVSGDFLTINCIEPGVYQCHKSEGSYLINNDGSYIC